MAPWEPFGAKLMPKGCALTERDIIGLVLSYLYAFGLLFAVEALGKRLRWPQYATRKLVHIGAGMWVWAILAVFDTWLYGLIPFATFIVLNYLFYRYQLFQAMDATDSSPGTVYFAFSITLLFALFWRTDGVDRVPLAVAATMAMTWGDGVASLVGQRFGRHCYTVFGHRRSWEGTVAMVMASFGAVFITLLLLPASGLSPGSTGIPLSRAVILALVVAVVGALVEGLSPAGTDNLSVPVLTAAALYLLW